MGFRAALVDVLPRRLWRPSNFYMPFNHRPIPAAGASLITRFISVRRMDAGPSNGMDER